MEQTYFCALLFTSFITSQADECIVGVMGENIHLPCIYNGVRNWTSLLLSTEWRRNMKVIHNTNWTKQQDDVQKLSNKTTVSSLAIYNGAFVVELNVMHLSEAQNYSLYLTLQGQGNTSLVCTFCLTVSEGLKSNAKNGRWSKYLWILSSTLCVVVVLLVASSLGYQWKLDRDIKRRKHLRCEDDTCREEAEMIGMDVELWTSFQETDV